MLTRHKINYKIFLKFISSVTVQAFLFTSIGCSEPASNNSKSLFKGKESFKASFFKISALITGGFYTQGITKLLKDNSYSYIIIPPYSKTGIDEENYRFLLSGKCKPIKELTSEVNRQLRVPMGFVNTHSNGKLRKRFEALVEVLGLSVLKRGKTDEAKLTKQEAKRIAELCIEEGISVTTFAQYLKDSKLIHDKFFRLILGYSDPAFKAAYHFGKRYKKGEAVPMPDVLKRMEQPGAKLTPSVEGDAIYLNPEKSTTNILYWDLAIEAMIKHAGKREKFSMTVAGMGDRMKKFPPDIEMLELLKEYVEWLKAQQDINKKIDIFEWLRKHDIASIPDDDIIELSKNYPTKAVIPVGKDKDGKFITKTGEFLISVKRLQDFLNAEKEKRHIEGAPVRLQVEIIGNQIGIDAIIEWDLKVNDYYGLKPDQIDLVTEEIGYGVVARPEDIELFAGNFNKQQYIEAMEVAKEHQGEVLDERAPWGHGEILLQAISSGRIFKDLKEGRIMKFLRNVDNSGARLDWHFLVEYGMALDMREKQRLGAVIEVSMRPRGTSGKGGAYFHDSEMGDIVLEDSILAMIRKFMREKEITDLENKGYKVVEGLKEIDGILPSGEIRTSRGTTLTKREILQWAHDYKGASRVNKRIEIYYNKETGGVVCYEQLVDRSSFYVNDAVGILFWDVILENIFGISMEEFLKIESYPPDQKERELYAIAEKGRQKANPIIEPKLRVVDGKTTGIVRGETNIWDIVLKAVLTLCVGVESTESVALYEALDPVNIREYQQAMRFIPVKDWTNVDPERDQNALDHLLYGDIFNPRTAVSRPDIFKLGIKSIEDLLMRYLDPEKREESKHYFEHLLTRKALVDYLDNNTFLATPLNSSAEKIRVYALNLGEEIIILSVDIGRFTWPDPATQVEKAWSLVYGRDSFEAILGDDVAFWTEYQVTDRITGEKYGTYTYAKLLRYGLPIGVTGGMHALSIVPTDKTTQEERISVNSFSDLLSAAIQSMIILHSDDKYLKFDNDIIAVRLIQDILSPMSVDMRKDELKKVTTMTQEEAIVKFTEQGIPVVMGFISSIEPELLENMKTWNEAVYLKLKTAFMANEMLFKQGELTFHATDRQTTLVFSKSYRGRNIFCAFHFAEKPFRATDGKIWFRVTDLDFSNIKLDKQKRYKIYGHIEGYFYDLEHTGKELGEEGWAIGIPVLNNTRDMSPALRFQFLEIIDASEAQVFEDTISTTRQTAVSI